MARKFNKEIPEKWVTFPHDKQIQFLITPFTYTYLTVLPTQEDIPPHLSLEIFSNSVKNWKGILDIDETPMKCSPDMKINVAKQDNELLIWVTNEIIKLSSDKEKVSKAIVKN